MFENAQSQVETILAIVKLCPEPLQETCFKVLLEAYVASLTPSAPAMPASGAGGEAAPPTPPPPNDVPEAIRTRFNALVARTKAEPAKATALFDFTVDPFNYHALDVPGSNTREKMRNVALLLALKGYLASSTTGWEGDWKEFRVMCVDHGCWDASNFSRIMSHEWFKTASAASGVVQLSPSGTKAAEALFGRLSGSDPSST